MISPGVWPYNYCADCGELYLNFAMFMLRDELWRRIAADRRIMLCIGCAEGRLGRPFARNDFMKVPVSDWVVRLLSTFDPNDGEEDMTDEEIARDAAMGRTRDGVVRFCCPACGDFGVVFPEGRTFAFYCYCPMCGAEEVLLKKEAIGCS